MRRLGWLAAGAAAIACLGTVSALAQVPPDIEAKLVALGRVVAPADTGQLYGPMLINQSYDAATVVRDLPYGTDPRLLVDVFSPKAAKGPRPVLLYLPGGVGTKVQPYNGKPVFYDNIMLQAVAHGMVGVNAQRRLPMGLPWDFGAHDIADSIDWVHKNIAKYGGDPNRIVVWSQSNGSNNLSNYLSHPAYWPGGQVGIKGAILMSGGYNLAPIPVSTTGVTIKPAVDKPVGPPGPELDAATLLQRSVLEGMKVLKTPLFLMDGENDPPRVVEAAAQLNKAMCDAHNCPKFQTTPGESHMSEVMSVGTPDTSVSGPAFAWIATVDK